MPRLRRADSPGERLRGCVKAGGKGGDETQVASVGERKSDKRKK
jgi:hypothetical protein